MPVDFAVFWMWVLTLLAVLVGCMVGCRMILRLKKRLDAIETAFRQTRDENGAKILERFESLKDLEKQCAEASEQWKAMAERLDAQGARVLELEHRVSIKDTVVPNQ